MAGRLEGIVWDFDGTLVDTRERNLAVNRRIIEHVTGRPYHSFPALASPEAYHAATMRAKNWRDLYQQEYGFDEAGTDSAGRLWTEFQLADSTPVKPYDGIPHALEGLSQVPHGIVSQNSASNIRALLGRDRLDSRFAAVIGYEEVPIDRQKPDPFGLLLCLAALGVGEESKVFYIGDHATDAECAFKANRSLRSDDRRVEIISIAVSFDGPSNVDTWRIPPDHVVSHPRDILRLASEYR